MRILLTQFISNPIVMAHLANALCKKSEVSVLIAKRLYREEYFDDRIDVSLIDVPNSYCRMLFKTVNPSTYYSIVKKIKEIAPDVINITWDFLWYNLLSPYLKKYPLILTDEEPLLKVLTFYGKSLYKIFKSHTYKMSDVIIVHGKRAKKHLSRKGVPESKIRVIPIGALSLYTKWKRCVAEEKCVLLFGAIEEYKGLEYLIKAAPLIISSVPDARIIIAGRGKAYQKYKNQLNEHYFEVHNRYIPDEEVAFFFERAAVVVLPYTHGSSSGVIPLAYAFRKPVVVTDVGDVADPVEDGKTGFVIPPRDEKSLAEAVVKLLVDENLREKMKMNIKRKVENELSWERIADRMIRIYEEAMTKKNFQTVRNSHH
jgi:glycosyltransferase involved in cell wall biosynthesis